MKNAIYNALHTFTPNQTYNWAIIPIYHDYAELIYSGLKKVEYRKKAPRENISIFILYETSPISAITGFFISNRYIKMSPNELWKTTKLFSGIDKKFYFNYFKNKEFAYGIYIIKSEKFNTNISLQTLGINTPQTVVYI